MRLDRDSDPKRPGRTPNKPLWLSGARIHPFRFSMLLPTISLTLGIILAACSGNWYQRMSEAQAATLNAIQPTTQATATRLPAPTKIPPTPQTIQTPTPIKTSPPDQPAAPSQQSNTQSEALPPGGSHLALENAEELLDLQLASSPPVVGPTRAQISLPDLRTVPPSKLRLVFDTNSRRKYLRFTNSIWNSGPGRLELIGRPDDDGDHIMVSQRLFKGEGITPSEAAIGEFIFHEQHKHWHLEGFALYAVWSIHPDGSLDTQVVSGTKRSYCLLDIRRSEAGETLAQSPRNPAYTSCTQEIQGLSPGWMDVYEHSFAGQWVEITGIPDGIYALVSVVNPDGLVREVDYGNNTGLAYFELEGMRMRLVEETWSGTASDS